MGNEILKPIRVKVENWIKYNKNWPKGKYEDNPKPFDDYRSKNDMDCNLTNGNLFADTIISLSLPMRFVLRELDGYTIEIPSTTSNKYIDFLE